MSRASSNTGRDPISVPGTPGKDRQNRPKGQPKTSSTTWIEIDDDDDLDELATDSIPNSSPYFTQPTQILNRATQPTQVINRTTLRPPSSPAVPSSPATTIEVPASSPFQPKSSAKPSMTMAKKPGSDNKVGSLMAPAGTAFRSPVTQQTNRNSRPGVKKQLMDISDDDLIEDYKQKDSSDDDSPMRGDIRPSSFVKKETGPASKSCASLPAKTDISINDIKDARLRHLTREVHRIVKPARPEATIQACKNALLQGVGWQVSKAVDILLGKNRIPVTTASISSSWKSTTNNATSLGKTGSSQNTLQKFITSANSSNSSSPKISPQPSNSHNTQIPRRRLIQGRKNKSPSPPAVFSVSSSATSPPSTPAQSDNNSPVRSQLIAKMAIAGAVSDSEPEEVVKPRRRLQQGRRNRSPAQVITIDSDSDLDGPPAKINPPRKRKAQAEPEPQSEPEPLAALTDSSDDCPAHKSPNDAPDVLDYLNRCSAEELGRMTGLPADAKLMISARPFKTLADAERVARMDKNKSKSKSKRSRTEIGSQIVEKLSGWFEAFQAAEAVIKQCEERGVELQSIMSTWTMDKNGRATTGSGALDNLPITKQPSFMDESVVKLKSYQLLGLNWMHLLHSKGYSAILADDMGLGKTCQVVAMISHLVESYSGDPDDSETRPWPNLIVVPPSTYENWMSEFERFAPEITLCPYSGPSRRDIDLDDARQSHVVLTTYSQVERQAADLEWLQAIDPYAAIFDEGHKLKNRKTLIYKQMMRVPTQWRLVLSGTPVQNNLKELLTLLHFVEPGLFREDDFDRLETIFEAKVPNKDVHNFAALAKERVSNARTIIAPFILQRRKTDVLDLAQKTERNEVVDMHPDQKAIYDEIKGRYLLPKGTKRAASTIKESNPWMQLRKAAIHHQLFRRHFTDKVVEKMTNLLWEHCSEEELYVQTKQDRHKALFLADLKEKSDFALHLWCKDFKKYIGHLDIAHKSWEESPKVQKLLELVRVYMKNGDRVLVFSRFEMVIDILRETLHHAEIRYCELTGGTGTADRFPEIQRFNESDIPVFLLTTGAGGTGLNLTAANKIILFDQSDNPQEDVQASNRAHRIGQTRDVEVIRLITKDTVEGLVYNSCVKKLMLAACVEGEYGDDEEESVEEQCRKQMLLETLENEVEAARPSQHI